MQRIVVLGATGSVGRQTLDIVREHPERFTVVGLSAGSNVELFARQLSEFQPRHFAIADVAAGLVERPGRLPLLLLQPRRPGIPHLGEQVVGRQVAGRENVDARVAAHVALRRRANAKHRQPRVARGAGRRVAAAEAHGYPVVMHTHDENVTERKYGEGSLDEYMQLMRILPTWAAEMDGTPWPINVPDAWEAEAYGKWE